MDLKKMSLISCVLIIACVSLGPVSASDHHHYDCLKDVPTEVSRIDDRLFYFLNSYIHSYRFAKTCKSKYTVNTVDMVMYFTSECLFSQSLSFLSLSLFSYLVL